MVKAGVIGGHVNIHNIFWSIKHPEIVALNWTNTIDKSMKIYHFEYSQPIKKPLKSNSFYGHTGDLFNDQFILGFSFIARLAKVK